MRHGHYRGGKQSPTYRSWRMMLNRCLNPNFPKFAIYGARGITVCAEWMGFEGFLADMGERPDGTTIDRIDNDGNYEPGNCRWATPKEQSRNQRTNRPVERSDGARFGSIAEAAESVENGKVQSIWNTCAGLRKSHRGYGWSFL